MPCYPDRNAPPTNSARDDTVTTMASQLWRAALYRLRLGSFHAKRRRPFTDRLRSDITFLEIDSTAELERTSRSEGCDIAESSAAHSRIWVGGQLRIIEQVEGLNANLKLALSIYLESTEDACIHIRDTRPAKLITVGVSEVRCDDRLTGGISGFDRVSKGGRVEPRLATGDRCRTTRGSGMAPELMVRSDQIGILCIAGRVVGIRRWAH